MAAGRSSSYSDRLSRDYERQFGRPADANDPAYGDWIKGALPSMVQSDKDAYERSKNRWKVADKFAWGAVAAPFAFAAAPAIAGAFGGAGGAAGAAGTAAGTTAGTAGAAATGAGMNLGSLWNIANLGVNTASSIFGARSQNKSVDRQIALQREENAQRLAADAEARVEAKRQFDAQQANEAHRIAAEDEERSYTRRLLEEREARLAPYRAQADMARRRLAAFLGLR